MASLFSRILLGKELAKRSETLKHRTAPEEKGALKKYNRELLEVQKLTRRALLFRGVLVAILGSGVAIGVKEGCDQNYGFDFTFDESFNPDEISRIRRVIELAFPELEKYIPSQDKLGKTINVSKSLQEMHLSETSYRYGVLTLDTRGSDGLIVHELVHLFHGNRDLYVDFIEEGLATAISILVTESVGVGSWDTVKDIQLNSTLSNGGMCVLNNIPYDSYTPLKAVRYYMAAKLWLDLERQHPGFIREFHELYYDYLDKGGSKESLGGRAGLDIVRKIAGNIFDKTSIESPIMRHEVTSVAERKLLYARYTHFKSGERLMTLNFVTKNQDGAEKPIGGRSVSIKFMNVDNGVISRSMSFYTQPNGEVNIPLNEEQSGYINLESELGHASSYKVLIEVDDIKEEFEFFYR